MNVLLWLIWATAVGLVWVGFCASDLPSLLSHLIHRHHGGAR
ncbi:hypothetical protein [Streptomyces sp. SID5910]|nr:hypothetical protein [Streptomyces sp. SID5910]